MTTGITESQYNLLQQVPPSKQWFFLKMFKSANQAEDEKELRRIERLLMGACDDIKEVKASATKSGNMLKSVMSVFGFAGGEAKRHKDS
jgi:hypothetical protein